MPSSPGPVGTGVDAARRELRARVRRGRLVTAAVIGTATVLVAVVALLGGFRDQDIRVTDVAPGATLETGPFAVSLVHATVQHAAADDYEPEHWTVTTTGTIANTGDTGLEPNTAADGFVFAAVDLHADGVAPDSSTLGDPEASELRENLSPGVGPVPWVLTFVFRTPPGEAILVGVYEQEYATRYILDDEQVWQDTEALSKITLPLERLPDRAY